MGLYSVAANAACASNALKVALQIATGSGVACRLAQFEVSFDGADSTKTPILVELVAETGASSTGGAAVTPTQVGGHPLRTAQFTARGNDTTDGASPTVLERWYVSPTSGIVIQYPLGREPVVPASSYLALRVTTVTGSGTPDYAASALIEE